MSEKKVICMMQHPLFRPRKNIVPGWLLPGHGDCSKCKPCKDNRNCDGYKPMNVGVVEYEVIEKDQ